MGDIAVSERAGGNLKAENKCVSESKTPWFVLNSPELGKPFQEFYEACRQEGVLDRKTKELLMLVSASAFRCPRRIEEHIKSAMEAGISREQITEALIIAAAEAVGTGLEMQRDVYLRYLCR